MNKKLELALTKSYPQIFQDIYGDITKTNMAFGIECDDGWYELIDHLCSAIMNSGHEIPYATQIKEKYGELRFYISNAHEDIHKLISTAEDKSETICEICGQKGELRENKTRWLKTLCKRDAIILEYE